MKPELVTIPKIRLTQLGVMVIFLCALSFSAGYCYRGPGKQEDVKKEEPPLKPARAAALRGRTVKDLDPDEIVKKPSARLSDKAAAKTPPPPSKVYTPPPQQTDPEPKTSPSAEKAKILKTLQKDLAPVQDPENTPAVGQKETKSAAVANSHPPEETKGAKYTVQVASFKSYKDAENLVKKLSSRNFPAYIRSVVIKGVKWHRVRVGEYHSLESAKRESTRMDRELKLKSMVMRRDS